MNSLLRRKPKPVDLRTLPDAEWRIAESLGKERKPVAVPALLAAMHGWDEGRAEVAGDLIFGMRDVAIPPLMDALRQPNRYDQEGIAHMLAQLAPGSVPHLVRALHDRKTMHCAAMILADLKAPEAVPELVQLATTGKREQRRTAVFALGRHGSIDGYDTVMVALDSGDKEMRSRAAYALGGIGDARAVEPLVGVLSYKEAEVRLSAILALGKLRDPRSVAPLIALLRKEAHLDWRGASSHAAEAVAECQPEGATALMEAGRDPDPEVRYHALVGLGRDRGRAPIRDNAVIRFLGEAVDDDDEEASRAAASALKPYEDRLAAEVLLPHLRDPRPHVRAAAIWGIWAHGDDVVAELARLLSNDPEADVRRRAAWGLGVTRSGQAETPLLEAIAADSDDEVVENAKKSLGWVREARDG